MKTSASPPDGLASVSVGPSASLVRLVVFLVDDTRYAVPLDAVERAFRMPAIAALPGAPAPVIGALNLRGTTVPVIDLRLRFRRPAREYGLQAQLLIVRTTRRTLAIPTDAVIGVLELPTAAVADAETLVSGLGSVAGIAALPEGLVLIHDLEALLSEAEDASLDRALGSA